MLHLLRWFTLATALLSFAAQLPALAQQSFPDRPIRLVVAFVAGGATDTVARQIADDLKNVLGQPVVVENRAGANGYIAWNHVASSEPDGYTLLLAESALAISQALYKKNNSSCDPVTQYDAIAGVATSPSVLIVANSVPANSVAELVALSRTVPQKMNFASAGIGSVSHLNFEVFKAMSGMEAVHIPYKGGGQAIADVVAGHVPMTITSIQAAKGLVENGSVKGLAVNGHARSPALPNVPTLEEAGVPRPDVDVRFWYGVFAPKGISEPIKQKLENAIAAVLDNAELKQRFAKLDITPSFLPASELKEKLAREIANWTKFIDRHGIKPQ